jgi:hypothetical protein
LMTRKGNWKLFASWMMRCPADCAWDSARTAPLDSR